jgi:hypothetical protein
MMPTRRAAAAPAALRDRGGPVHLSQDLPRLGQEHHPGSGQPDMVGAAFQEAYPQLTLKPLDLLAQRRLDDVLPGGCAAEVEFLGQGYEIAKLT